MKLSEFFSQFEIGDVESVENDVENMENVEGEADETEADGRDAAGTEDTNAGDPENSGSPEVLTQDVVRAIIKDEIKKLINEVQTTNRSEQSSGEDKSFDEILKEHYEV